MTAPSKSLIAEWEKKLLEDPTILAEDKWGCLKARGGRASAVCLERQEAQQRYHELAAQVSADRSIRWPNARFKKIWDLHALEGFGRVEIERRTGANHREISRVVAFGEKRMSGGKNVKHVRTGERNKNDMTPMFRRYHRASSVTKRMVAALDVGEVLRLVAVLAVTPTALSGGPSEWPRQTPSNQ